MTSYAILIFVILKYLKHLYHYPIPYQNWTDLGRLGLDKGFYDKEILMGLDSIHLLINNSWFKFAKLKSLIKINIFGLLNYFKIINWNIQNIKKYYQNKFAIVKVIRKNNIMPRFAGLNRYSIIETRIYSSSESSQEAS